MMISGPDDDVLGCVEVTELLCTYMPSFRSLVPSIPVVKPFLLCSDFMWWGDQ